jgi:hypothetical protein
MRRHQIFYAPGFISLFGVLGLFLFLKPPDPPAFIYERPFRIWLPYDNGPQKYKSGRVRFTKQMVDRDIRCKKIIEIDLDGGELLLGDTGLLNKKKQFIEREFQRMQFTGDTMSVLKVDIGRGNSFGDFMWIQKLAQDYHVHRYTYMDDSFIFFASRFQRSVYISLSE